MLFASSRLGGTGLPPSPSPRGIRIARDRGTARNGEVFFHYFIPLSTSQQNRSVLTALLGSKRGLCRRASLPLPKARGACAGECPCRAPGAVAGAAPPGGTGQSPSPAQRWSLRSPFLSATALSSARALYVFPSQDSSLPHIEPSRMTATCSPYLSATALTKLSKSHPFFFRWGRNDPPPNPSVGRTTPAIFV